MIMHHEMFFNVVKVDFCTCIIILFHAAFHSYLVIIDNNY